MTGDTKRYFDLVYEMRVLAHEWEQKSDADKIRVECAKQLRERIERIVQR